VLTSTTPSLSLRGGSIRANNASVVFASGSVVATPRLSPPVLVSAQLSDTGAFVTVTFSKAASSVLGTSPGSCALVFANTNLGLGALCVWLSPLRLQITFGFSAATSALLTPMSPFVATAACQASSSLVLVAGAVTAVPGALLSASGCVNVAPASNPPTPFVRIVGATRLGLCSPLVLDGSSSSGGGGRAMTFGWALTGDNEYGLQTVQGIEEWTEGFPFSTSEHNRRSPSLSSLSGASCSIHRAPCR
jgi:hypothetical protein